MYDELKEKCRACSQGCNYPSECSYFDKPPLRCMRQLLSEAADAIEELSAIREEQKAQIILMAAEIEEQLPRWISMDERLPEEKGEYMVFLRAGSIQWGNMNIPTGGYSTIAYFYDGKFHKADGYVTHWMPLPEPPKEEQT